MTTKRKAVAAAALVCLAVPAFAQDNKDRTIDQYKCRDVMREAGANVAYVNPKEGALAWLDTWAMTSGVQDKELAEKWVDFVLQKNISGALSERTGFGNTVVPTPNANEGDKMVWLEFVEDPLKRADLWNEVKAAP